jgi:hypothetical protein
MLRWSDERLDEFALRMDERFDRVDQRFDEVDRRFEEVDRRLDRIEIQMIRLGGQINDLTKTMLNGAIALVAAILVGFGGMIALIATQL